MRCEICDYEDGELGFNENVDVFAVTHKKGNSIAIDKRDGKAICRQCTNSIRQVADDWRFVDGKHEDRYGSWQKGVDKEVEVVHYEGVGTEEVLPQEIELLDQYETELGQPSDLKDTVPELQDAGKGHK